MDTRKLMLTWLTITTTICDANYLNVSAIIGRNAEIPCELTPHTKTDKAYLVLWWFKDIFGTPIYSFDMRNNTKHWMTSDLDEQASFFVNRTGKLTKGGVEIVQSYLQIKQVQPKDAGFYRCRVDFFQAPTRNLKVKLNLISLPDVPQIVDVMGNELSLDSSAPTFQLGSHLNLACIISGGNPIPVIQWWHSTEKGSSMLLRSENATKSSLELGPLKREHHNSEISCEAKNNDILPPIAKRVKLNLILPPTRIELTRDITTYFLAEKEYEITCSTFGSNPMSFMRIWHNDKELPILETKAVSGLESRITATFVPNSEDDGSFLTCRAENPLIKSSAVEDQWKIDVKYAPKCSYKGPQHVYGAVGEKILLVCDMAPYPSDLAFEWTFMGANGKKHSELRRTADKNLEQTDKLHYAIPDERAFGKIVCSAQSGDESLKGLDKPCIFQIIPKDLPYLEACNVVKLNEKWITVECLLKDDSEIITKEFEFWVTILNSDGEKFMQSFEEPLFNVTHFASSGLLWIQVQAKGHAGYSNTIHIEINFKSEIEEEEKELISGHEVSISLLPILCLLAGALAVLLSIVAGILECSRRKYNVSNEVTHISFSNNLDINQSGLPSSFKTESYEQLNDVRFEGFNLHHHHQQQPQISTSNNLVQIHEEPKDSFNL